MERGGNSDLVVVGAGPGGMGAAYYAARLGLRLALLERERFPRDRVCGDGFLAQTVSEMERLGLGDWLLEPQHGVIEGFAVRTKTARFEEALPPDPRASRGVVARRPEFKPKILQRALDPASFSATASRSRGSCAPPRARWRSAWPATPA